MVYHIYCWVDIFMEAHGYNVEDFYVYHDNQSAMLIENNGIAYARRSSKRIKMKNVFIKDRSKDKDLKIIHCLIKGVTADFFTNSLQGQLFTVHRNAVIGFSTQDILLYRNLYDAYVGEQGSTNTTD